MTRIGAKRKFKFSLPTKADLPLLLLLVPAIATVLIFAYLPMSGILVAFKDYKAKLGIFGSPWADNYGFANFMEIFKTPGLPDSIWNTLYWNVLQLLVCFPLPIIFALLLDEIKSKPFKSVTQTISYLPHFLSWIAITGMVYSLLGEYGLINEMLRAMGSSSVDFIGDIKWFLPVYLLVTVWHGLGWDSIIYLSALSGISQDLYEAADIDGANRFQRVWHITIPHLIPTAMILLIMKIGQLFGSNFELVWGLQGPAWTTEVISTAVYNFGIGQGRYALATALGLLQGIVALVLTLSANKVSEKMTDISMW